MEPFRAALVLILALAPLAAQDPTPPPGGFRVGMREYAASTALGPITWADGVRTELDLYFPIHAPPPATGWPAVLAVHGGEGTRKNQAIRSRCNLLARMGYVCIAYDVRTDGATVVLNPPGFAASEADKLRDMADAFAQAPSLLPAGAPMDPARLAVTGESQGGRHAYRAAAWSGLALPLPAGSVAHMPPIAAVAPRIAPISPADDTVQDGNLMNANVACSVLRSAPANDPFVLDLLAEDYAAFHARFATDPVRHYLPGLRASTVPLLVQNPWADAKHAVAPNATIATALAATRPTRVLWATGGHSTPENDAAKLYNNDLIRRWFDRFLKGLSNGVENEPFAEALYEPVDARRRTDPSSWWTHGAFGSWPPRGTRTERAYLRAGGRLSRSAPTASEVGPTVEHRILTPGYGIAEFGRQNRNLPLVLQDLALDEERFDGPPLPADLEILGRPRVVLTVDADAGDFYLQAAIYAVDPNGSAAFVTAGTDGLRRGAAGRHRLDVEMDDIATVVPAGHALRVVLRNLTIHDPAGQSFLRWVPCFTDSDLTVVIEPQGAPILEVPAASAPGAFLSPRLALARISRGLTQPLALEAGSRHAGSPYVVLLSTNGHFPGTPLPGARMALNFDAWTTLSAAAAGAPPFVGTIGLLDPRGHAQARFDVGTHPAAAVFLGQRLTFAAGGFDAAGFWATGPAQLDVLP